MKTPDFYDNQPGYPAHAEGPARLKSPAASASSNAAAPAFADAAYHVEESSCFPFSCTCANDCTGIKNHPVPGEETDDMPYGELYPFLPPKL